MTRPSNKRDERVRQIRERTSEAVKAYDGGHGEGPWNLGQHLEDVETLLSLLDSQAAQLCLHCEKPIRRIGSAWLYVKSKLVSCRRGKSQEHKGIYRAEPVTTESIANDAATRIRDLCVEKLRDLRHESESDNSRWNAALYHAETQIQSLTLEQGEHEK